MRWCETFLRDISPGPSKCSAADPLPGPASPTNTVREAGSTGLLLPTSPKPSEAGRGKPCHAERLSTVRKGALDSEHMTWSPVPVPPLTTMTLEPGVTERQIWNRYQELLGRVARGGMSLVQQ